MCSADGGCTQGLLGYVCGLRLVVDGCPCLVPWSAPLTVNRVMNGIVPFFVQVPVPVDIPELMDGVKVDVYVR